MSDPSASPLDRYSDVVICIDKLNKDEVLFVDTIIGIEDGNIKEIYEKLKENKIPIPFAFKCIEYLISIRPHKIKPLFSLFVQLAKDFGYKGYENNSKFLRRLLVCKGIVHNYGEFPENESFDDIIGIFPKGSVEKAIIDDDVDLFIKISGGDFDPMKEIKVGQSLFFYKIDRDEYITYMQLMAFFGSVRCFKAALLSGNFYKDRLNKYAIAGGNVEIIRILGENSPSYYDSCFETSVKFHHHSISNWLLNNYKCEDICKFSCTEYFNYRAFSYFEQNKIDVPPNDFDEDIFNCSLTGKLSSIRYNVEKLDKDLNQSYFYNERTALHVAAENGFLSIVEYISPRMNNAFLLYDKNGRTPLHFAAQKGYLDIVRYLVEENICNTYDCDNKGRTPIIYAIKNFNTHIVNYILEITGDDINDLTYNGEKLIKYYSEKRNTRVVQFLVDKFGVNVE